MPIIASFKSLLKNVSLVKSETVRWLIEPRWSNRLTLYFSILLLIYMIFNSIFSYFGFLHTDVDSARYMLSALVQGEAAIVAIVITLSLVAAQLAASSYSARVVEVFRKTPDLWILIWIYGVAIFYGLGVLKLIEKASPVNSLSNLENSISFSYYLGIFAFMALIPYTLNTLYLLKPSTVIKMLSGRITKQTILAAIGKGQERTEEKDPIQPIIDIVRGSLMKYDYETARDGLRAIKERAVHILKDISKKKEEKENMVGEEIRISMHIFEHLTRIGRLAASMGDEGCAFEVIDSVYKIGNVSAGQKLINFTEQAGFSLFSVGMEAAKRGLENAAIHAKAGLQALEEEARKNEVEVPFLTAKSFAEKIDEVLSKIRK